jgi:hypothetical protein
MSSNLLSSVKQRAEKLDRQASGFVIGGVRILAGLLWLANIHWKVPGDFGEDNGGGLYKYSASTLRHATFCRISPFLGGSPSSLKSLSPGCCLLGIAPNSSPSPGRG